MTCKSKRRKRPKKAQRRATKPLELVYMDYAGPFQNPTTGGAYYDLIFVDCCSWKQWIYQSPTRDAFLYLFKQFVINVGKLSIVRTDNWPELVSAATETYFLEQGIRHETSGPHNQHQNGVAEQGIQTIMEMVQCMLRQSNAQSHLRGHAAKLATHTSCFTPSNSAEG
eukprot:992241-Rhodomonas_salina.1